MNQCLALMHRKSTLVLFSVMPENFLSYPFRLFFPYYEDVYLTRTA